MKTQQTRNSIVGEDQVSRAIVDNFMHLARFHIFHDLSVVRFLSDRIMVMNRGKIEEIGAAESVLRMPHSDYTRSCDSSYIQGEETRAYCKKFAPSVVPVIRKY